MRKLFGIAVLLSLANTGPLEDMLALPLDERKCNGLSRDLGKQRKRAKIYMSPYKELQRGLRDWYDFSLKTYDPDRVHLKTEYTFRPTLTFQEVQTKACYWENEDRMFNQRPDFKFEDVRPIGKKHRIRTYNTRELDEAIAEEGIIKEEIDWHRVKRR